MGRLTQLLRLDLSGSQPHFVLLERVGDYRIATTVPVRSAVTKPAPIMEIASSGS
jgi:hypothetical protein